MSDIKDCADDIVIDLCEEYIDFCQRNDGRLPNMAGFFRWLRLGHDELSEFRLKRASLYKTLSMLFEDEAINSLRPPSIVSLYIKQYFKNGDESEEKGESLCGPMTLIFDHDIAEDGQ